MYAYVLCVLISAPCRSAHRFSSPWCIWANPNQNGHGDCATVRKAWDKLGGIYNYSRTISVSEVDCSRFVTFERDGQLIQRETLCRRFDINSYPTIYYFTGETGIAGKKYKGEQVSAATHTAMMPARG